MARTNKVEDSGAAIAGLASGGARSPRQPKRRPQKLEPMPDGPSIGEAPQPPEPRAPPRSARAASGGGPVQKRLFQQGLGTRMMAAPGHSVLSGYVMAPASSAMCSESNVSRSQREKDRRERRERERLKGSEELDIQSMPQLQTTLNNQLEVAWAAVASLFSAFLPVAPPSPGGSRSASARARAGRFASGGPSERPASPWIAELRRPSSGGGLAKRNFLTPTSSPKHGAPEGAELGQGQGPPSPAPSRGGRETFRASLRSLDHSELWKAFIPEETQLGLIACSDQTRDGLSALRGARAALAEELARGSAERERLQAEIASSIRRLELSDDHLTRLGEEYGAHDARLEDMIGEHAKIVDSSRLLLDAVHRQRGELKGPGHL